MKNFLIAFGLIATLMSPAQAGVWVNPGFYSHHFDKEKDLNNNNRGLGVEVGLTDTYSLTAGVFENSDRGTSHYVGTYVMPYRLGGLKAGVAMGAFNGYPKVRDGGWFPSVVPTVAIEGARIGLNVSFVPKIGDRLNSALTFQVKFKLAP